MAEGLYAGYGEAIVLEGISFALEQGGSLALVGRNGVGKTTLLLTLMGLTRLRRGRLLMRGEDLSGMPTYLRARRGLGWVPQERLCFPSLTVDEHLLAVARPGPWDLARVYRAFPALEQRRRNLGNQLSGGEQQMLAIARALMTNPSVLLLDEPLEGLAPIVVEELTAAIRRLRAEDGAAFILVEQHAEAALSLTETALVLERGGVVHQGASRALLESPAALDRFVGLRLSPAPG
jgi:branched-chain amino acid transport system ATP-binding protein